MSTSHEEDCDYLFKAVLVGDSAVGKSNLLWRFSRNEFFLDSKPTLGVEFATRIIELGNKVIKAQIWDTAGQERFKAITSTYYRGAHGALLVYDVTRRATFESAMKWLREIRHYGNPDMVLVLVGNKSDLTHLREVRLEEGKELAEMEELCFMETSALENVNVEEAFVQMIKRIYKITRKKLLESENTGTVSSGIQPGRSVQLDEVTPIKTKCCEA